MNSEGRTPKAEPTGINRCECGESKWGDDVVCQQCWWKVPRSIKSEFNWEDTPEARQKIVEFTKRRFIQICRQDARQHVGGGRAMRETKAWTRTRVPAKGRITITRRHNGRIYIGMSEKIYGELESMIDDFAEAVEMDSIKATPEEKQIITAFKKFGEEAAR